MLRNYVEHKTEADLLYEDFYTLIKIKRNVTEQPFGKEKAHSNSLSEHFA